MRITGGIVYDAQHDHSQIVEAGTFTAAPTQILSQKRYEEAKLILFAQWNINGFFNHFPGLQNDATQTIAGNPPAKELFTASNVNVAAWADYAKNLGAGAFVLSAFNEYGFPLWPSDVPIPVQKGTGYPYHQGYYGPVEGIGDTHIMEKFTSEMGGRGIIPAVYMNLEWSFNLSNTKMNLGKMSQTDLDDVIEYWCLIVQELYIKFGIKYFWMDAGNQTDGRTQKLFNALMSVAPDGFMLCNSAGATTMHAFPYHADALERYALIGGGTFSYMSDYMAHNGSSYYVAHEIIGTPQAKMINGVMVEVWYAIHASMPFQPLFGREFIPGSEFQQLIDIAAQYNRPLSICIQMDNNGDILQDLKDYYGALDFSPLTG
jgi:hypothetical protein